MSRKNRIEEILDGENFCLRQDQAERFYFLHLEWILKHVISSTRKPMFFFRFSRLGTFWLARLSNKNIFIENLQILFLFFLIY